MKVEELAELYKMFLTFTSNHPGYSLSIYKNDNIVQISMSKNENEERK